MNLFTVVRDLHGYVVCIYATVVVKYNKR